MSAGGSTACSLDSTLPLPACTHVLTAAEDVVKAAVFGCVFVHPRREFEGTYAGMHGGRAGSRMRRGRVSAARVTPSLLNLLFASVCY